MALEESQDCSWVAREWEATSFFVWFLYASKSRFEDNLEVCRSGGRGYLGHSGAAKLKKLIEGVEDNR